MRSKGYLTLSRKPGQKLFITRGNEEIEVVADIRNGVVRLSIKAPPHYGIRREELPPRPPLPVPDLTSPAAPSYDSP